MKFRCEKCANYQAAGKFQNKRNIENHFGKVETLISLIILFYNLRDRVL